MNSYSQWKIQKTFKPDTEIYFSESIIVGLKTENDIDSREMPGKTIYKVVDNDERENTVVLVDQEGNRYKFNQTELAKALAENSSLQGFQCLQYPVGYVLATSNTDLSKLSIYDPRLRDPQLREKDISKILPANKPKGNKK